MNVKEFFKKFAKIFIFAGVFVIFLVTDIVTKQVIIKYFASHSESIVLLGSKAKPFLQISYSINTNAAFGFGLDNPVANRVIYSVIAFIGFGLIVGFFVWKYKSLNILVTVCLGLIAVGAIGNLIDRLFYSPSFLHSLENGVVDWIDFVGVWPFIFNIADSCVVVGTLILIVYLIVDEIKAAKAKRKEEVKESSGKVLSKEEQSRLENKPQEETKEVEEIPAEEPAKEE